MKTMVAMLCILWMVGTAWATDFVVVSQDVSDGGTLTQAQILNGFGCNGGNISPELHWSGAPAAAKSFALTVYDPDAPTGSGWWHWVVFNIPASITQLPAGAGNGTGLPAGAVQSRTDFGTPGYGGACPPPGMPHRYVFTVHALDVERLELNPDSSAAMVGFMLGQHTLAKATLTAVYGR